MRTPSLADTEWRISDLRSGDEIRRNRALALQESDIAPLSENVFVPMEDTDLGWQPPAEKPPPEPPWAGD